MTRAELDAAKVVEAIHKMNGNLTAAARIVGISRQKLYMYMTDHPTVKAALQEARESMIDHAESVLYKKVLEGEAWAVCFFLKTQGKHRGYVERQEVAGTDGGPVKIEVVYVDR